MSRLRTIGRRAFLTGSVAIAGGVAFGTYIIQRPYENPLVDQVNPGDATFNAWIKVTPEQIVLIAPHGDKGQGVASMQAALIAEELDAEFGQFDVDFGAPAPAYYNTAIAEEIAPFMSFDDSFSARAARGAFGAMMKVMGIMGTGGSSSVPDSYEKLRHAGAVARETLKLAASLRTGVPVEQLKTRDAAVHLPDGTEIKYVDLATEAADIPPVTRVTLRDPSEWRLIGKPMQRLDILPKSTGTLNYGIDRIVDGMVHAAIKINPRQGGPLNSYDDTAARRMRGVLDVFPVTNGVAVIADNTWRAFQAANAVSFDWGPAPYPPEMAEHWAEVENSFVEERLDAEWRHDGDVDVGLADGNVVEAEYRVPYVAHAPLEPIGAIVRIDEDGAEVWAGHQLQRTVQDKVAAIAGLEPDQVIYHNEYMGGSFGHRLEFENIKLATEIAMQMKGTPVKLTFSREDDFAHDFPRQIAMSRSAGVVRDGKVDSWSLDIAAVSSSTSQGERAGRPPMPGSDPQLPAGAWNMPYAIPNLRVRAYRVPELAPTSSWRSVGASHAGFFAESFLDELIHEAGADPMEERLRLINNDLHRNVLEAVAEMSSWGSDLGANRGRGVAMTESFGVPTAEVVEVTNTPSGIKIDKVYVALDVGRVIDPINFENLVQGGVVWALGHAINCEITYSDGMAEQTNYHAHEAMRIYQCPEIHVRGLENAEQIRGVGEPPVPPAPAALANAIFAATGTRLREMPFNKFIKFV